MPLTKRFASIFPCSVAILFALFCVASPSADISWAENQTARAGRFPAPKPPPRPVFRFFGAVPTSNSADWARIIDRADSAGLLVLAVIPGSPAAVSGIAPGDVIVAINEREVRNEELAVTLLRSGKPNYRITVTRPDGKSQTNNVVLSSSGGHSTQAFLQADFQLRRTPLSQLLVAKSQKDARLSLQLADQLVQDIPDFAHLRAFRASLQLSFAAAVAQGEVEQEKKEFLKAELQRARELDPGSADIRRQAARILIYLDEPAEGEREAVQAVRLDDSSAQAHWLLGTARLTLGRPLEALPHLHRAVQLNGYGAKYYEALKDCYSRLGQNRQAEQTSRALETLRSYGRTPATVVDDRVIRVGSTSAGFAVLGALIAWFGRRLFPSGDVQVETTATSKSEGLELRLAEVLGALGLWSLAVPTLGPTFGLLPTIRSPRRNVEIVDHVLPGLVVLGASVWLIIGLLKVLESKGESPVAWPDFAEVATGIIFLAGFWITSTHIGLISQAAQGDAPWSTTVVHSSAGLATMTLSAWLYRRLTAPVWTGDRAGESRRGRPSHGQL